MRTSESKKGKIFEYHEEEDQGQANQGKPSKLVASLILVLLIAWLTTIYKNACFILLLPVYSNY
jgi:hypothetical protein